MKMISRFFCPSAGRKGQAVSCSLFLSFYTDDVLLSRDTSIIGHFTVNVIMDILGHYFRTTYIYI